MGHSKHSSKGGQSFLDIFALEFVATDRERQKIAEKERERRDRRREERRQERREERRQGSASGSYQDDEEVRPNSHQQQQQLGQPKFEEGFADDLASDRGTRSYQRSSDEQVNVFDFYAGQSSVQPARPVSSPAGIIEDHDSQIYQTALSSVGESSKSATSRDPQSTPASSRSKVPSHEQSSPRHQHSESSRKGKEKAKHHAEGQSNHKKKEKSSAFWDFFTPPNHPRKMASRHASSAHHHRHHHRHQTRPNSHKPIRDSQQVRDGVLPPSEFTQWPDVDPQDDYADDAAGTDDDEGSEIDTQYFDAILAYQAETKAMERPDRVPDMYDMRDFDMRSDFARSSSAESDAGVDTDSLVPDDSISGIMERKRRDGGGV